MPVAERCGNGYNLISAKVPARVYIGTASAARGEGSLSRSHHSRKRRVRRVRWFTHEAHRGRAGTGVYKNMLGPRRKSYRNLAD